MSDEIGPQVAADRYNGRMLPALVIVWANQSPLDAVLSFTSEGKSVPQVARELEVRSGLKITTAANIRQTTLVIRVENWSLRKLLNEVARVLSAEWKETSEGIVLSRSDRQEKELIASERSLRLAAIRKWQNQPMPGEWSEEKAKQIVMQGESLAQRADPRNITQEMRQQAVALGKLTPDYRASVLARKKADTTLLAEARPGRRVVLSSRPNSLQQALKGADEALATFQKEQALFYPLAEASLARVPESMNIRDVRKWSGRKDSIADRLIFTSYDFPAAPAIMLRSYLVAGHTILSMTSEAAYLRPDDWRPLPSIPFETPAEVQSFLQAVVTFKAEPLRQTVGSKTDPVSWVLGPTLIAYSKALKKDLVAAVPDMAAEAIGFRQPGKDGQPLIRSIDAWCQWEERENVLLIRPFLPISARNSYIDRTKLFEFADKMRRDKRLTFDAAGEYLKDKPVELATERLHGIVALEATSGNHYGLLDVWNSPVMRFWGRLPGGFRSGSFKFAALPGEARTALSEWFFATTIALQGTRIDSNDPDSGLDIRRLEPSELFPKGIPGDMELDIRLTETPIFWFDSGQGVGSGRLEDMGSFATQLDEQAYKFAVNTSRTLKIGMVSEGVRREIEIDEPHFREGLKWTSGKDLDPKVVARLKLLYEKEQRETPVRRSQPPP